MDFWLQNLSPIRRFAKFCERNGYWDKEDSERCRQETRAQVLVRAREVPFSL